MRFAPSRIPPVSPASLLAGVNLRSRNAQQAGHRRYARQYAHRRPEVTMPGPRPRRPAADQTDADKSGADLTGEARRLLDRAAAAATGKGRDDLVARVDAERSRLCDPACLVLVVG